MFMEGRGPPTSSICIPQVGDIHRFLVVRDASASSHLWSRKVALEQKYFGAPVARSHISRS